MAVRRTSVFALACDTMPITMLTVAGQMARSALCWKIKHMLKKCLMENMLVNTHNTYSDIQQLCILPTNYICMFCTIFTTNRRYFSIQYKMTGFYNLDGVCLLSVMPWFRQSVTRLSQQWPRFNPRPVHVRLTVEELKLRYHLQGYMLPCTMMHGKIWH